MLLGGFDNMKYIDLDNWNRKEHYIFFKDMDNPYFSICATLDIDNYYNYLKENSLPFFISTMYATTHIANSITEFKYRIQDDRVVIHESIDAATTIMSDEGVFTYSINHYYENYKTFLKESEQKINEDKKRVDILSTRKSNRNDVIYMTSLPWISFTSISHPLNYGQKSDSIPRIAWGKFYNLHDRLVMPVSIQLNHALADGYHAGLFFNKLQELFNNPSLL